jgi:hypothetical protein
VGYEPVSDHSVIPLVADPVTIDPMTHETKGLLRTLV